MQKKLSKMFKTFIRPILEYASVVSDGCTNSDKLEKEQLYAARILTGLHILASKASLYFEIGCEALCERRKKGNV